jgi:hypothetical protein
LLVKPLCDFLLLKNAGLDEPVPLAPILAFFDDKKLKILKEYVESICRLRDTTALSLNQLRQLVEDLESVKKEGNAEGKSEDDPAAEKGRATVEPVPVPPAFPAAVKEDVSPGVADRDGTASLPDLRSLIGEKQRHRFIRHVFNKDQAYFFGVIATLNTLHTWDEAAAYLKQVYFINRLDPFSGTVVEFTDLVQQRFSREADTTG